MDNKVAIYEARYERGNDDWEFIMEPSDWLLKFPWHNFKSVTLNGSDDLPTMSYRRRVVSEDEASAVEENYLNYIANRGY